MLYGSYKEYDQVSYLATNCRTYATAFTKTMLDRAYVEDSEIFAKKGMNRYEMQDHMVNNMCLKYDKLHARSFRDTTA